MCQIQAQVKKYKLEICLNCYLQLKLFIERELNQREKFNSKISVPWKDCMTKQPTTNSPYGEAFLRRNVLTEKCPYGKVVRGETSYNEKSKNRKVQLNLNSTVVNRLIEKKLPYISINFFFILNSSQTASFDKLFYMVNFYYKKRLKTF